MDCARTHWFCRKGWSVGCAFQPSRHCCFARSGWPYRSFWTASGLYFLRCHVDAFRIDVSGGGCRCRLDLPLDLGDCRNRCMFRPSRVHRAQGTHPQCGNGVGHQYRCGKRTTRRYFCHRLDGRPCNWLGMHQLEWADVGVCRNRGNVCTGITCGAVYARG